MTVKEAIALLEPIPEREWIEGQLSDGERCCVVQHLRRLKVLEVTFFALDTNRLLDIQLKILKEQVQRELWDFCMTHEFQINRWDLSAVNDNLVPQYKQPTAKARVLAYLNDRILKMNPIKQL